MKKRTAFTLIELLVVIAIIALLVSILLPSLRKAKLMAQSMVCSTMLRNFASANNIFASEYGHRYTPVRIDDNWPANTTRRNINWYANLDFRRILGADVTGTGSGADFRWKPDMLCANSGKGPKYIQSDGTVNPQYYYGYNLDSLDQANVTSSNKDSIAIQWCNMGVPRDELVGPADKLMFADANQIDRICSQGSTTYVDEFTTAPRVPSSGRSTYTTAYRHFGKANVVFFDGHAALTHRDDLDEFVPGLPDRVWNLRYR